MEPEKSKTPEREWTGSIWKHPYFVYILLTVALFAVLLGIGWLAWTQGWIPNQAIS